MAMRPRTLLLLGLDQKLSGMTVKKKYSLSVKMSIPTRMDLSF